jgi:hypothetical protein
MEITFVLFNDSNRDILFANLVSDITLKYNHNLDINGKMYQYANDDPQNLFYAHEEHIRTKPKTPGYFSFVFHVPDEAIISKKSLVLNFTLDGKHYSCKLRSPLNF